MTKSGNFRRPKPVNVEANKLCEKVTKISQKLTPEVQQKLTKFFASTLHFFSPEFTTFLA